MEYVKGSEWRRWDLHIHTPGTQKNDQYEGKNIQEKWDKFYEDILSYVNTDDELKRVSVIGITDYFSIDNYRKVVSDKKLNDKFDLILPNIEMRVSPVSSRAAMNIHFICNPLIVDQLDSKLFHQLRFNHSNQHKFYAIKEDFIKLGKLTDDSLDEDAAYKKGLGQFVVELNNLKEILEDRELRENVLVVVSNSSNDGASGIGNPSRPNENSDLTTIREDLYYFADMIFSSNQGDVKYFLGKGGGEKDEIIRRYGKLKPCIHGCDAHTNSKILNPDDNRFCWIKADCTFNGLKQVVYEPEERVIISSVNPNTKKDYHIIEKITINDERFSSTPIFFNPNLTCIIGGKSTGKSIILNNMARQIDYDQYQSKFSGNEFLIQSLKVHWKDQFISDGGDEKRHIVYIPQTYLNRLSDEQEEKTEIDKIIQDVILQDENIFIKYREFTEKIEAAKVILDKDIYDLLKTHGNIENLEQLLKESGTSDTITKEISKLQKQRDKITKALQISDKEIDEYEELRSKQKELNKRLDEIQLNKKAIESLKICIDLILDREKVTEEIQTEIEKFIERENSNLDKKWQTEKSRLEGGLESKRKIIDQELIETNKQLIDKEKIIEKTENLKTLNNQIEEEEKKLSNSKQIEVKLKGEKNKFDELFKEIIHKFSVFNNIHQEFASYVNEKTANIDENMKFIATAPFRLEKFDEKIRSVFNNKKLKNIYKLYDGGMANDVDEQTLEQLIKPLFQIDGVSYLKNGNTLEEVLRAILSNWFNIVYTVELDNDKIQTMSPGKKALVLLKLLINLAEADCPILIDQPEDDLDNRSIYDELVGFLRKKKYDRQIIIVTHNANIVLGADSEEIIVANQEGTNSPNENFRFEYRSGAIENNNKIFDESGKIKKGILNKNGIQDHVCEILEGGKEAFNVRMHKYTLI